jgi:hypothetical protein
MHKSLRFVWFLVQNSVQAFLPVVSFLIIFILFGIICTSQGSKPKCIPVCSDTRIKKEPKEDGYKLGDDTVSSEADELDTDNELTLLGSMKATVTGSRIKKKKNSKKKLDTQEFLQKKCAAQQEEQV